MSKGKDEARRRRALEARLMVPLTWWANVLGLAHWSIQVVIVDHIEDVPGRHSALAQVTVQTPYRQVLIEVATEIEDYTDAGVERCVLHELLHVVVSDLNCFVHDGLRPADREGLHDRVETLCDTITITLLRLRYGENYVPITIRTEDTT